MSQFLALMCLKYLQVGVQLKTWIFKLHKLHLWYSFFIFIFDNSVAGPMDRLILGSYTSNPTGGGKLKLGQSPVWTLGEHQQHDLCSWHVRPYSYFSLFFSCLGGKVSSNGKGLLEGKNQYCVYLIEYLLGILVTMGFSFLWWWF